jgi:hypothetical protein
MQHARTTSVDDIRTRPVALVRTSVAAKLDQEVRISPRKVAYLPTGLLFAAHPRYPAVQR